MGVQSVSRFFFCFSCKSPAVLTPLVTKALFAPLYCFCSRQLTWQFMWVCVWALYSLPRITDLSVCSSPRPHCLQYCSFRVKYWRRVVSVFRVLLLQYCIKYSGSFAFYMNFRNSLLLLIKCWYFAWDCPESTDQLEELISWHYWVFLSRNMVSFSIYLVLLTLSELGSFPHIELVHILLDLYLTLIPKYLFLFLSGWAVQGC